MATEPVRLELLSALARKVLWLSSWTIHHANHVRPNADGLKVGGHQASASWEKQPLIAAAPGEATNE